MPAFLAAKDPARGGPLFRRLVGRLYAEGDLMPRMIAKHFVPLLVRFAAALERALPDLPHDELYCARTLCHGIRCPGSARNRRLGRRSWHLAGVAADAELTVQRLVNFLDAAFRAPVVEAPVSGVAQCGAGEMMHGTKLPVLFLLAPLAMGRGPDPASVGQPLALSLKRAVELAISPDGNYSIQEQEELVRQSKAQSAEVRSALLPNVGGYLSETSQIRSLAALGSNTVKLPFNFKLPNIAGPYPITDIRANATQTVFDFSAIRRWQAARKAVHATEAEREHATNEVSALVAKAYVAALHADADVEAANADVALAKALVTQAENEKNSGTGTGIDDYAPKSEAGRSNAAPSGCRK